MNSSESNGENAVSMDRRCFDRKRRRVLATTEGIVVVHLVLDTINTVQHLATLTFMQHLCGIVLWIVLPLLAVALMWRGRASGRWILIVLFGLRGIVELVVVVSMMGMGLSVLLAGPMPNYAFQALFYSSAAAWLFFSPNMKYLRGRYDEAGPAEVANQREGS
jgi:heme/copper-type cytochrome/quinol oxidase subunit 4